MDNETRDFLSDLEDALDGVLSGKPPKNVVFAKDIKNPELRRLADKATQLFSNIYEVNMMTIDLSRGKLDGFMPSRQNMLAGPFKHMQSQFSTLDWHLKELLKGKIVPKMQEEGELFKTINELIDRVAGASTGAEEGQGDFAMTDKAEQKMNSWRYHQILMAVNMLEIMVIEVDSTGKVVYANTPGKELLDGRDRLTPDLVDDDTGFLISYMSNLKQDDQYPVTRELSDESEGKWCRITSDKFALPNGQQLYLHVIDDVTDWKQNEERLEEHANVDPLTGMLNRRAGLNLLKTLQEKPSEKTYCVAFIDIDNLKNVNDNYGHGEGDEYIRAVADVLKSSTRATEAVVRYGGDEFFVVLRDCGLELANKVLARMQDNLEKANAEKKKPYKMSFSYGVNVFGGGKEHQVEEILDNVDEKMYIHKTGKKQRRAE
ncbi:diguanylate cyclase [Christensenellaceae bacterium OttesenSCG-928-K19]|nr:diguanylate cyclase [Christensenellaceae bacterium OttesenSCG-928-K19]